jgi:hypothetical protein
MKNNEPLEISPELETDRLESERGQVSVEASFDPAMLQVKLMANSLTKMPSCTPVSTGHSRKRLLLLQ